MIHTLEHMSDPLKTLSEAFRVVKSGANIIVEVPNIESIGAKLF